MAKPILKRTLRRVDSIRAKTNLSWSAWLGIIIASMAQGRMRQILSSRADDDAASWLARVAPDLDETYAGFKRDCDADLRRDLEVTLASYLDNFEARDDDVLAWAYQYLNRERAAEAFSQTLKNGKKLSGEALLAATQFFTDSYMVEHLVREIIPESIDQKYALRDIRVIDPACGGGNSLATLLGRPRPR
ncbi:MAG: hypothetical protein O7B24_01640, partial [Alphaproteobacteria bacterium]|nr:hypothetical protein [Alphaproteobacteria bacterium]